MVSKEVVVKNGTGLHARPATLLVKKASSFKSLAVTKDSVINVIANGDDEALAVEEIVKLIENLED